MLTKNPVSKSSTIKTTLNNNIIDRNKLFSSPKIRNSSENYKTSAGKISHIQYINSKQNSLQKSKNATNSSLNPEKRTEISKIRVNSAKNNTLSPNKNLNTISTKSNIFKPEEITKNILKIKNFDEVKNVAIVHNLNINTALYNSSNSTRMNKRAIEKK